jgi:Protein of unknown function (DUF3617)
MAFALGLGAVQAGLAQTAEAGETVPAAVDEPGLQRLAPGQYRMTSRMSGLRGQLTPDLAPGFKGTPQQHLQTICLREGDARLAPPFFTPVNRADCERTEFKIEGNTVSGDYRCTDTSSRGGFRYTGTFTPDSAQMTIDVDIRTKQSNGALNFRVAVEMIRTADICEAESGKIG